MCVVWGYPFSQHHLLNRSFFPHCIVLAPLFKKQLTVHVRVYFWRALWKIPWAEESGRLQSMGLRRVRLDWATSLSLFTLCSNLLVCMPILMPILHWFDYWCFVVSFQIGKYGNFPLRSFLKVLSVWGPLRGHTGFKSDYFYFCETHYREFGSLVGITLNLWITLDTTVNFKILNFPFQ